MSVRFPFSNGGTVWYGAGRLPEQTAARLDSILDEAS